MRFAFPPYGYALLANLVGAGFNPALESPQYEGCALRTTKMAGETPALPIF